MKDNNQYCYECQHKLAEEQLLYREAGLEKYICEGCLDIEEFEEANQ